jgi:hypothetical protein
MARSKESLSFIGFGVAAEYRYETGDFGVPADSVLSLNPKRSMHKTTSRPTPKHSHNP